MEKFFKVLFVLAIIGLIGSCADLIQSIHQQKQIESLLPQGQDSLNQAVMAGNNLDEQLQVCEQFSPFAKAMDDIGSIPYNSTYDNCYDHSKQLSAALAKDGIQSSIMVNKGRTHAWVAVWIEATTGHFITPQQAQQPIYSQLIEVRNGTNVDDVECYQGN